MNNKIIVLIIIFICLDGCEKTKPLATGIVIANQRAIVMVDDKMSTFNGGAIKYINNYTCVRYSGNTPCMLINFNFDIIHSDPGDTLVCMINVKANPVYVPAFSAYKNGEIRREFTLDAHKMGNPVVLETTIQKDVGDRGLVNIIWACKYKEKVVASADINVDLGK